jgi:CHAT domain-containing protein
VTDPDARARGWALKDACYAAWHTEPSRARGAAEQLQSLAASAADPELQALAAWAAGIAALAAGELGGALAALEDAHERFAALGDGQHAAETQVPQMVALAMLGRDTEAVRRGESALGQFVASGDIRSAAKVEGNLGTMLSRQDRHAEAERRFRAAGVRFARVGDIELSIAADVALANALSWQFQFDEAARVYERVRMRAGTHGFGILLAQAHQGIGRLELNRGRWHRALHELAEATRLLAEHGAPPQRRIEAEAALADAYLGVNLLAEAVALYDTVIQQAVALQAPAEQAWATLQRARALGRQGDAAGAIAGLLQARDLYAATDNPASLAFAELCRGRVELAAGRSRDALASARAAAAALRDSGITGWQLEARVLEAAALAASGATAAARQGFEAVLAEAAALPQLALPCHAGLGRLAWLAGAPDEARAALETALALIDGERAALPDDEFRRALGAEAEQVHDHLVAVSLTQGHPAQLMADLERGRGQALALSLPNSQSVPTDSEDSMQLQWLRDQWRQAVAEGDGPRLPTLAGQVQALEMALLEAHRRALLRPPDAAAAATAAFDVGALQAALPEDTALLAWHRLGARLVCIVVTREGVRHVDTPAAGLDQRIRGLRFQIEAFRAGGAGLQRHAAQLLARTRDHAQALHTILWAPVAPLLGGRRRVVLVPHRELHYLPFGALHDGQQWLVQTHCLSVATSATVWLAQRQRPSATAWHSLLALGVGESGLPQVAQEIAAAAAAFGAGARILLGPAATQDALLAAAPAADVLHLACHGRFRADNPAFSFLQLADGPLTMHDARRLRLRAGLVVLSACETGLSRIAPGDEVLGLVRAFTLAGAGAVLATLWPVDDAATAALVQHFYRALRAGAAPATALQQAQATAAAAGAHPFHWAAFTLHGHG